MVRKPGRGKRVFVGVSGGVDSSVSALLLKLQGYDVMGVFIRTWQPDWIECTWRDERRDAMRVCAHLNIPFVELDLEREYKEGVADYMIAEYRAGRTPNPDVMCNREVKFGGFLNYALREGAQYVATGHYAQNINDELVKGIDFAKDQSYFLWTLSHDQLKHILFPVGHLRKSQVRKLAKWFRLPTATKKDSQGICFIGDIDMKEFLKHYIDEQPGDIVDESGNVVGRHNGVLLYTLGERHGFEITTKGTDDQPYYVVGKDIKNNTLMVSHNPNNVSGKSQSITLRDTLFRKTILNDPGIYHAQIRYHGEYKSCRIETGGKGDYSIIFEDTDLTITPGQSVVIYDGDICVGGGVVA